MLPKRRIHFKQILICLIICILLFCAIKGINTINKNKKIAINNEKIITLVKKAEYLESNTVSNGITYYVSADGTSLSGTDINDPMSLENANTKKYYGNDKILLKRGDIFYGIIDFNVNANTENLLYIGNYGDEEKQKPIISGANILNNIDAWEEYSEEIYKINLASNDNFTGIKEKAEDPYNIGFFIDNNNEIHGNRKSSLDNMKNEYDFYCNDNYIYIKIEKNKISNNFKFIPRSFLVKLSSNSVLDSVIIENCGGHGISKKTYPISNVYIKNCTIQNIGGSVQTAETFTRYGNGIEFWNQAENTVVSNCIIKNTYDAGYTIQGNEKTQGFINNICKNNIFINCTYPIELFDNGTSFSSTQIENNIIINQGKGWGHTSRPDQYQPANLVIWNLPAQNSDITYLNNRIYNSRTLYFKYPTMPQEQYKNNVKSDNNVYYMNENTNTFISDKIYKDISNLATYGLDTHSSFYNLSDSDIEEISNLDILNSTDYDEIINYYNKFDTKYRNKQATNKIKSKLNNIKTNTKYSSIFDNLEISNNFNKLMNSFESINNADDINQTKILETYNGNSELSKIIYQEYEKNNIKNIKIEGILKEIDDISDEYKEIFSYYVTEDNINIAQVMNILNSTIESYNNNTDVNLNNVSNMINTAKKIYNENIQSDNISQNVLNKQRILNLCNLANSIIEDDINKFKEDQKLKISVSYDKDLATLTNEDITVTVSHGTSTKITNNNGKNTYTFTQNGTFDFWLDIKGDSYKLSVGVNNINRDYKIQDKLITNISKNTQVESIKEKLNLSNNYSIIHNGQTINLAKAKISTGDILKNNDVVYTLIVNSDITRDGDVTIYDLVKLRKYLLNIVQLDNEQKLAADSNQDSNINKEDLSNLRKEILE